LRAGDLVTTGAWLVQMVQAGDTIQVDFDGYGAASVLMSGAPSVAR
jgi:2-keto-4-pentenoate hydratase